MVGWLDGRLVPHTDIFGTDPQAALVSRTAQLILCLKDTPSHFRLLDTLLYLLDSAHVGGPNRLLINFERENCKQQQTVR